MDQAGPGGKAQTNHTTLEPIHPGMQCTGGKQWESVTHLIRAMGIHRSRPAETQLASHLTDQHHSKNSNTTARQCIIHVHAFALYYCIMSASYHLQHVQQHGE